MFMTVQSIVNLEIGRIGPLVIDHVMVVSNIEQERSRLLLNMEESFAKEMQKRFKFVTLNLAQSIVFGTNGTNGNNAASHAVVESPQEHEISNSMHN